MLIPESRIPRSERNGPIRVCILGSTGSVGTSALEVIAQNPEDFELIGLAAGSNIDRLKMQVEQFRPAVAVLEHDPSETPEFNCPVDFSVGAAEISALAQHPDVDVVLAAISGVAGLSSTIAALQAGKTVALANKESLVCAGMFVRELLDTYGGQIIPVDSEHSALFQAMQGDRSEDISHIILTASGGPFLHTPRSDFHALTPEQALKHPRWDMGVKITIDSATLMNKALELIEAHWLFGIDSDKIEVVIHPQSIVHSIVAFVDGTQIAQLSHPDMRGPIAYALRYPSGRARNVMDPLSLAEVGQLDFFKLDGEKFESIQMARDCLREGGLAPVVFNIANEVAVERFLAGEISFSGIYAFVQSALNRYSSRVPETIESLLLEVETLQNQLRNEVTGTREKAL